MTSKVRISTQANTVAVAFALNPAEFREGLRAASSRLRQTVSAAVSHAPETIQATPAVAPRREVIRIEGMDDGPREIPMNLSVR